ncbi:MAG: hypothetical protein C3F11_05785 [Methylocystaceae bacterium]|nr:MAG: hypothetical protein C3F11_05785 [Methylocystaceae bacterium]
MGRIARRIHLYMPDRVREASSPLGRQKLRRNQDPEREDEAADGGGARAEPSREIDLCAGFHLYATRGVEGEAFQARIELRSARRNDAISTGGVLREQFRITAVATPAGVRRRLL